MGCERGDGCKEEKGLRRGIADDCSERGGMHEGERGTTAGVRFLRDRLTDYPGMVSASSMHSS